MSYATLDNPATNAELNQFYGVEKEPADAAFPTLEALRRIRACDFDVNVAKTILIALNARIANSNFSHVQSGGIDVIAAVEYADDAIEFLGGAV